MRTVGSFEAKTHLGQLLDEVEQGASITITKHGRPVAILSPPPGREAKTASQVIDEFIAFSASRGCTLGDLTIREMIDEGRR